MMYEIDEDGCPLLDWLEEWGDEWEMGCENSINEEKEFNAAGFEVENYNFF